MSPPRQGRDDQRVLILAPRGRDAAVMAQVLVATSHPTHVCESLDELVICLDEGAGVALATEEALARANLQPLVQWIASQPPWSDFPVIVLATKQPGRRSPQALAMLSDLGNVVLLERPLNAETLLSAARSAQRARSRQYQMRLQLEEQERAGRMKDEFLATLSHELRTPLSAILGWVHLLKLRAVGQAQVLKGVETIERNARAQARLIEELLDMSRINAGSVQLELKRLMPAEVLEAAIASLTPEAEGKRIRIERHIDPDAGPVAADAPRLQQIIGNLLANALKFTPQGECISVSLEAGESEVVLRVADNGIGISADFLPFVFDRFRQADGSTTRAHGGLGLGLAIVHHLVALHGGDVKAESEGLGRGATFTVRLPTSNAFDMPVRVGGQSPPEPSLPGEPPHMPAAPQLRGLRVLLVDDDHDALGMLSTVLDDEGATVTAVGSASEAIDSIETQGADVLISDIAMPHVDGYELLRHVRTRGHLLPAIALTAFARAEDRSNAFAAGYSDHLSKPVEPLALVSAVVRLGGTIRR